MESSKEMTIIALQMRANYIETGNVSLSRNDAILRNEEIIRESKRYSFSSCEDRLCSIKQLTDDQQELVLKLRKLANDLLGK